MRSYDRAVSEPTERPPETLRRNRDFRVFTVTQALSTLGDAVAATALPLLVLALTGSGLVMGVVAAMTAVGDFVTGLLAGAIADRGDRKRLMLLADLGRATLTALIPISALLGGPTLVVILLVTLPLAGLRSLFVAGYLSSLPGLVGRPNLGRANGVLETVANIGFIAGPAIAGVLSSAIGPGPTLALDAVSFAISAFGIVLIRRPLVAPGASTRARVRDDIRIGIAFVARHPVLRAQVLLQGLAVMGLAPMIPALAVRITRDLGQPDALFGLAMVGFGVGAVVGSLLAARIGSRIRPARLLLAGWFGVGAAIVATGLVATPAAIVVLGALEGVAEAIVIVAGATLRAASSPDELLGRVASTGRTVVLGLQPIGLLAGGALIDAASGGTALAVLGTGICVVAAVFALVRPLRNASAGQEPGPGDPPSATPRSSGAGV